jgi:hypothetical protein
MKDANARDAKTYRGYVADCIRIAQSMGAKDTETLVQMGKTKIAREAERNEKAEP